MRLGVFDSGIGGQAVAERLAELLPDAEIISVNDHDNVPYGSRLAQNIIELSDSAMQPLFNARCDAIVIACNTVTTVAIQVLRERHPNTIFIGIEPMVKPAATITKTKTIAVLATPATLASDQYTQLKKLWATDITVIEPDCSAWAALIESGHTQHIPIENMVNELVSQQADVIVLACTHFHWLKKRAEDAAGSRATVLEPSDAISDRILTVLGKDL